MLETEYKPDLYAIPWFLTMFARKSVFLSYRTSSSVELERNRKPRVSSARPPRRQHRYNCFCLQTRVAQAQLDAVSCDGASLTSRGIV